MTRFPEPFFIIFSIKYNSNKGKRQLGRSTRRWEDNIDMDLKKVWWESVGRIRMAQDRNQQWVIVNMFGCQKTGGEFLDKSSDYYLITKDSILWN
jgi:hypothetical protein